MDAFSQKPRLGCRKEGVRRGRLLFVCFYDPNGISTVYENIALWQACSEYELCVLNLWPGRGGYLQVPPTIQLKDFDGVIVHSTASYSVQNLRSLDSALSRKFTEYDGLKILMKQDEQVRTFEFARFVREAKFDLVVTCVPESELRKAYPEEIVGEARFLHAYTGYISPYTRSLRARYDSASRPIDVSYRGSLQPLQFGRLGFEKRSIGDDIGMRLKDEGLNIDISSRWEDRYFGAAWFDFLGQSKVVLGVESGANLFDFDGSVEEWCSGFAARNADRDPWSPAYYHDADRELLHRYEGNVQYGQVSPRHFEAACAGAAQALYEGEYSGIFLPGRHYIPIKRDMSNLESVRDLVGDERARRRMAECAFDEVVDNPAYQYETFVERFDAALADLQADKASARATAISFGSLTRPRAMTITTQDSMDSESLATALEPHCDVCELGIYAAGQVGDGPSYERVSKSRVKVRAERLRHDWTWMPSPRDGAPGPGVAALLILKACTDAPRWALTNVIGAIDYTDDELARFRQHCTDFVNANAALIEAGRNLGAFDAIVACDLKSLPAAITLAKEWDALLLFDAQECWPYSNPEFRSWENDFWSGLERMLVAHADRRSGATPDLAGRLEAEYGMPFSCGGGESAWLLGELLKRGGTHRRPVDLSWIDKGRVMRRRSDQGDIPAVDPADLPRSPPPRPYMTALTALAMMPTTFAIALKARVARMIASLPGRARR